MTAMETETPAAPDPRASYYAAARSWAEDARSGERRACRVAWTIAMVATGVAALEAIALSALAPLKTVVPYTLLVDRNTGFAQALSGTRMPVVAPQSALAQSLLAQYVIAREGFDITGLRAQYRHVALWSAGAARADYLAAMAAGAPDSPLARLPRDAVVDVSVESVSWIGAETALVRFTTARRGVDGAGLRGFWIATISYRFSGAPMALADRLDNPLGFQVTRYRRDQEAAPQPAAPMALAVPALPAMPLTTAPAVSE